MQKSTAELLVRAILRAFAEEDRGAAEALIAPDFHFTSPLDNRIDRAAYFKICWPNSAAIESFEIIRIFEQTGMCVVTYEGSSGNKKFRNTEVMTCRGGQIVEVEVYFGWNIPHAVPAGEHVDPQ